VAVGQEFLNDAVVSGVNGCRWPPDWRIAMNGNGEIPVSGFRRTGGAKARSRDGESLDTAKRAAYTGGKGRNRGVIDFTGGALKKKSRKNIFADVVERRRDEGNFMRVFFPTGKKAPWQDSKFAWLGRALRGAVVGLGALLLFMVIFFNEGDRPQDPDVPAVTGNSRVVKRREVRDQPLDGAGAEPAAEPAAETAPPVTPAGEDSPFPAVVRNGVKYRPPLPGFKQVKELNAETLDGVWDSQTVITKTPWIANNLKAEHEVVDHIYCFLRTHTPEELALRADPELGHTDMMVSPGFHRGKVVNMRAKVLRVFEVLGWEVEDGKRNASGIMDTTMLFVRDATPGRNPYIFVILVAQPPWEFKEHGVYEFTAVFMKRYPYKRKDNKWETHPLLVAMELKAAEVSQKDSLLLTAAIVFVALVAMIILYFAVRGETRDSEEKRRERLERRKTGRDRLKQQIESARLQKADGGEPPAEEEADGTAADEDSAPARDTDSYSSDA
jgi:hypothetical protein